MPEKHKVYKYLGIYFENLSDQIPNTNAHQNSDRKAGDIKAIVT